MIKTFSGHFIFYIKTRENVRGKRKNESESEREKGRERERKYEKLKEKRPNYTIIIFSTREGCRNFLHKIILKKRQ